MELDEIVKEVNSSKVLDPILLKGPLELRVDGDDDRLSLALPVLSLSYYLYTHCLVWSEELET